MTTVPVELGPTNGPARTKNSERGAPPSSGPLVDPFGRIHDDLRISVTDRCNLRCTYCMPEKGMTFLPSSMLLSFDEIVAVASAARDLGVTSVRLTGGEPLVRRGLPELVSRLSALEFDDLALTTNGMLLAEQAHALADAGLDRVNISCDSLRAERFGTIRRRGDLDTVLHAMDVAEEVGLLPLKVNVVLVRDRNDDEVLDFAAFARRTGRTVRFIEYMPLDADGAWDRDQLIPGDEVLRQINARWPLEQVGDPSDPAPAQSFRFSDGTAEIGIVSSVTRPFCGSCNRLRLTADGAIRNCLFSDDELDAREVLRAGGSDEQLENLLRRAVWGKLPGHGINEPGFLRSRRSMSMIGG